MADRAISALPTATTLTASDLFVLSQSNQAKNTTWQTIIGYLATALDGHGGINSITYTAPVAPSLAGTMTITLADETTKTISVYNGNGVNGVVQHWAVSSSDSSTPSTWYTTKQTMTPTNKYLWNYMTLEMDDGNDIDTTPCVVGVYGDTGDAWYMWIRYSGSQPSSDADMGTTPDDWIGLYSGTESDPSNLHYTDYTWFKYKGEKGDTGSAASISNQSVTYQESSSGTVAPSGSWTTTIPTVTQGNYLWTRTVLTYNSGTVVTSYSVARFGVDGSGSVASVNGQSPDGNGNVAVDADHIPMTDNQSVEAHINTLHKYMTVIGEATFEEEEYDSQISALVQWYGFTPESGDNRVDIKDGDLILIGFPQGHPWISTNPTRVGITTPTGKLYYLISGSEVTGTGEYQTHFAFRFNGTYLIPIDINGMTEKLDDLKTAISHAVLDNESQLRTASQKIQVYSNIFGESASAGFHNSIYRGKYLGNSFTADQHTAISNGTFDDLFIGDYWTIGGIDYVICHFDYYYECSDAEITFHHVVVMPRGVMTGLSVTKTSSETTDGYYQWNTSNTVTGGYVASRMRTAIMPACDTKVKAAFGSSYVKTISELYPTAHDSSSGRATGWGWTTTDLACDLCNETMVCGHQVWSISNDGRPGYEVGIDKWQLAIFALCPEFANIRATWWLRSVTSATYVAIVYYPGYAYFVGASAAYGVRPRFLLS